MSARDGKSGPQVSGEDVTATERDGGCRSWADDDREVFVCTPFRPWQQRLAERKDNSDG